MGALGFRPPPLADVCMHLHVAHTYISPSPLVENATASCQTKCISCDIKSSTITDLTSLVSRPIPFSVFDYLQLSKTDGKLTSYMISVWHS